MKIEKHLGQLSKDLAKLGLQQVIVERPGGKDRFRVIYVNKNFGNKNKSKL